MRKILPVLALLLATAIAPGAMGKKVNPFARPPVSVQVAGDVPELVATGRPQLRGVIVAGPGSIANLSGTLLALGEEAAGYQLQTVTDYSATFLHEGETITLYLEDEQPEPDQ
jgi:hypothetical protein